MTAPLRRAAAGLLAVAVGATVGLLPEAAAPAAAQAAPGYVAIVIQGGGTACVKWRSGITGDDVLNSATSVHYRNDGLIDQIGGFPSPPKADKDHYWSYWHDTSGSWSYSSVGASGWTPAAGTVEGWSYIDDGGRQPPSSAPGGLYKSLCGGRDTKSAAPKPKPVRSSTPAARRTTPAPKAAATSGSSRGRVTSVPNATGSSSGRAATSAASATSTPASSAGSGRSASAGSTSPAAASAASSTPLVVDASGAAEADRKDPGGGSALPLVLGLGLALVLAAGAGIATVRRRRADPGP